MTSKIGLLRIAVVLLFVITFTMVGWVAPIMYASHAPDSHFIEENEFIAEDTTTESDEHRVCFNRTIHHADTGQVFMELYLVDEAGRIHEVRSMEQDRFFRKGTSTVRLNVNLPDNIDPGAYHYVRNYEIELANGQVVRGFSFQSNTFNVTEGPHESSGWISC